ncbi:MAG: DUF1018 domain-containing protein [Trueperaceae bacterium]|nr:DUF1018 domain-containing protein [Trueperaceae bacterium]
MSLNERKEAYKQIHTKASELGMSEDAYRNTLKALTGFTSCTDLRPNELNTVLHFFNAQGSSHAYNPNEIVTDEEALAVLG